jgi:predicted acyl esterase
MQAFRKSATYVLFIVLAIVSRFSSAADLPTPIVERGVPVKMRDGTILRADIFRPSGPGKFPILLTRTPYDKNHDLEFSLKGVARGYVVINQDVRGRYTSEGDWYPFLHETDDGYDTIEWAAALPYSDGIVGMYGGSYVGAPRCWPRLLTRRTLPESAPSSPPAITMMAGLTRAVRSSSGSTNHGPPDWRKIR